MPIVMVLHARSRRQVEKVRVTVGSGNVTHVLNIIPIASCGKVGVSEVGVFVAGRLLICSERMKTRDNLRQGTT